MAIYRPYRYLFDCEATPCRTAVLAVEVGAAALPIPAEAARRKARAAGWEVRSRGNRRGWLTWCPEHAGGEAE